MFTTFGTVIVSQPEARASTAAATPITPPATLAPPVRKRRRPSPSTLEASASAVTPRGRNCRAHATVSAIAATTATEATARLSFGNSEKSIPSAKASRALPNPTQPNKIVAPQTAATTAPEI